MSLTTGAKAATSRNLSNLGLRALRSLYHSGPVLESKKKKSETLWNKPEKNYDGALRDSSMQQEPLTPHAAHKPAPSDPGNPSSEAGKLEMGNVPPAGRRAR